MSFKLNEAIEILQRTPAVLKVLLGGLSSEWIQANEGPETWNAFDILGHLIHGDETDWVARMNIILSDDPENKTFAPFDRFAQFEKSKGKTPEQLLSEFAERRNENMATLQQLQLTEQDLDKKGIHPAFGEVTLRQLLSTWVAHDLSHLAQISRVMAKRYKVETGPWVAYLRILQS